MVLTNLTSLNRAISLGILVLVFFAAGCGRGGETATSSGAPDPAADAAAGTNDGTVGPDGRPADAKKTK